MPAVESLLIPEFDEPFRGIEAVRRGGDLLRVVTWPNERGFVRATKTTTGEFSLTQGEGGHLEGVDLVEEYDAAAGYHFDYAFTSGEKREWLVAHSSWHAEVRDTDTVALRTMATDLRVLKGIEPDSEIDRVLAAYDEAKKAAKEVIFFRHGLIDPDIFVFEGVKALLADRRA